MFALKWINAPNGPQTYKLLPGQYLLGRGSECNIQIRSTGVSKQHVQFQVMDDKIVIKDLNSTNGTFVNGVKVQHQIVRMGDKILVHTLLFQIVDAAGESQRRPAPHAAPRTKPMAQPSWPQGDAEGQAPEATDDEAPQRRNVQQYLDQVKEYFETVFMPGIYRLTELFDYRLVIASLLAIFLLVVTSLSTIPMSWMMSHRTEIEAQRRALTLARYLEGRNREAIAQNLESALDVSLPHEEGVKAAWIIAHNNGQAMAPANKAGRFENRPFMAEAREKDAEISHSIDSDTAAASVPIRYYNPEQGAQITAAHAVVFYNMAALADNEGRMISLFVQVLMMALAVGLVVFVILDRLIHYPFKVMNLQLDEALSGNRESIQMSIQSTAANNLCSNINSALSRIGQAGPQAGSSGPSFLSTDIESVTQMIANPALAVRGADETILALNSAFEMFSGLSSMNAYSQPLDVIIDQALRLNIQELIGKSRLSGALEIDQLEMVSGNKVNISCKAVTIAQDVGFYLIVVQDSEGGG